MHTANTSLYTLQRVNEEVGIDGDSTILVILPVGLNVGFGAVARTAAIVNGTPAAAAMTRIARRRVKPGAT